MADTCSNLVSVTCPDHHSKLTIGLWQFFQENHGADFELQWGGERTIRAHRLLLDLFLCPDKLTTSGSDQDVCDPNPLFEFLYKGAISVPKEQLENLQDLARQSDFQILVEAIETAKIAQKNCIANRNKNAATKCVAKKMTQVKKSSTHPVKRLNLKSQTRLTRRQKSTARNEEKPVDPEVDSEVDETSVPANDQRDTDGSNPAPSNTTRRSLPTITCQHCSFKTRSREQMAIHQSEHDPNVIVHSCDTCGKRFTDEQRLQRHRLLHGDALHRCTRCHYITNDGPRFRRHQSRHDALKKTLECEVCRKQFTNAAKLVRHRAVHADRWLRCTRCPYKALRSDRYRFRVHEATHDPAVQLFKCRWCPRRMLDQAALDRHKCMRLDGANIHVCPHCDYRTYDRTRHITHLASHDKVDTLKCKICHKRFGDGNTMARHKCMRVGAELHACPHCPFKSHNGPRFRMHVARHDPTTVIYKCRACERAFLDESALTRHRCKLSDPSIQPFKCPHCPYTNKFAHQLGYHITAMHSATKPYKCEEPGCNYATGHKTNLRRHVASRHVESKPFVCEMCAFRTASRSHLMRHQQTHSDERRHKCTECGRTFRDPTTLKRHLLGHAGVDDRTHVCHVCGSAFSRRHNLRVHLRNVHKTDLDTAGVRWTPNSKNSTEPGEAATTEQTS